jgi:hypothetical protein
MARLKCFILMTLGFAGLYITDQGIVSVFGFLGAVWV